MDAQTLRRALADFFKFNPKDFFVQGCGTGFLVSAAVKKGGSAAPPVYCPFDVAIRAGETEGALIAKVGVGSVNQILPTNIYDEYTFSIGDVIKVKIRAVSDGQKITASTVVFDVDEADVQIPAPFALPAIVEVLVAVIVAGKPYRQIQCGSIELVGHHQFSTDKDPPAEPGQLPYTPYYVWELNQ